ncbi:hypothetical protein, partial [Mycolicibacterium canariasense]|uniref:hypothetical protein n=1 Tax=Mycolicibacterium canariasense TaxID=228230 RepID=UPI000AAD730D
LDGSQRQVSKDREAAVFNITPRVIDGPQRLREHFALSHPDDVVFTDSTPAAHVEGMLETFDTQASTPD